MTSVDIFYQGERIREIEHIEADDGHFESVQSRK